MADKTEMTKSDNNADGELVNIPDSLLASGGHTYVDDEQKEYTLSKRVFAQGLSGRSSASVPPPIRQDAALREKLPHATFWPPSYPVMDYWPCCPRCGSKLLVTATGPSLDAPWVAECSRDIPHYRGPEAPTPDAARLAARKQLEVNAVIKALN